MDYKFFKDWYSEFMKREKTPRSHVESWDRASLRCALVAIAGAVAALIEEQEKENK